MILLRTLNLQTIDLINLTADCLLILTTRVPSMPPLASCGSQEKLLIYPLVPNQADPKRVHSIHTNDWYTKQDSTIYYTRPYSYRLMVVLFSWVVAS
jgi:hypothetical protein